MVVYFCDFMVVLEILWVSMIICFVGVIVFIWNRVDVVVMLFLDVWILMVIEKK